MGSIALILLTFSLQLCIFFRPSIAFQCAFQTVPQFYYSALNSGQVFARVTVLATHVTTVRPTYSPFDGFNTGLNTKVVYLLRVDEVLGGCARTEYAVAVSESQPILSISLVLLETQKSYYMAVSPNASTYINPCNFIGVSQGSSPRQLPFTRVLTAQETAFLESQSVCCNGSCRCVKGKLSKCAPDACDGKRAPCAAGVKCVTNPCNECAMEWFDRNGLLNCGIYKTPFEQTFVPPFSPLAPSPSYPVEPSPSYPVEPSPSYSDPTPVA